MDLPVEIWMQVFENIRLDDLYARRHYVQAYCNAIKADDNTSSLDSTTRDTTTLSTTSDDQNPRERNACAKLPAFERQAYQATRQYYKINQQSRAAASQLSLSNLLVQTCSRPLNRLDLNSCTLSTFEKTHTAVFELFDPLDFEWRVERWNKASGKRVPAPIHDIFLEKAFLGVFFSLMNRENMNGGFEVISKFVMLAAPPVDSVDSKARKLAHRFVKCVRGEWRRLGKEGEVECWR